jgi:hypothetical protein
LFIAHASNRFLIFKIVKHFIFKPENNADAWSEIQDKNMNRI